ncbi:glycoside hydrolase family protein [Lacrimispora algidixylanolytica]|uniref:beta-fructofuranosidase n=1 Tax=Lacrimispora algidixylanolytica TaxID=94868 RepID=A0A419T6S8_9FIRM|nr:family 43 glycosylhydrolase [Lacrimispora algidixylanolytica]RKD33119.1 hypothetical protein BET01_16035 [Lacrimispora algidixylanolytica]
MRKLFLCIIVVCLTVWWCGGNLDINTEKEKQITVDKRMVNLSGISKVENKEKEYKLFVKSNNAWVGDIMPLNDGEKLQLYYLYDTDNNGVGYHPIHKFSTRNLYGYEDDGVVIPFGSDLKDLDLAVGTGSFILADGVYHCFYTGHNDINPSVNKDKECIMHAVSKDNVTWEKIQEDTFWAPGGYSGNDFRDPFVFFNDEKQCYQMLVSARKEGEEGGSILSYTSKDLSTWSLEGTFYEQKELYFLECPDLFKMGKYYYLFYSWNNVSYYQMSESMEGPWIKPEYPVLDGNAYYAAKTVEYEGKRYLFGFIDRKKYQDDLEDYSWAGNLCAYELEQNEDGTLKAKIPHQFEEEYFNKEVELPYEAFYGKAWNENNSLILKGKTDQIAGVSFGDLPSTMLLRCKVAFEDASEKGGGFYFGNTGNFKEAYAILLDTQLGKIHYDKKSVADEVSAGPITYSDFKFQSGKKYDLKVVVENEIIVIYLDNTKVLSNRIYRAVDNGWGIFGMSDVRFSDIQMFYAN